jgi:hypothetical protein
LLWSGDELIVAANFRQSRAEDGDLPWLGALDRSGRTVWEQSFTALGDFELLIPDLRGVWAVGQQLVDGSHDGWLVRIEGGNVIRDLTIGGDGDQLFEVACPERDGLLVAGRVSRPGDPSGMPSGLRIWHVTSDGTVASSTDVAAPASTFLELACGDNGAVWVAGAMDDGTFLLGPDLATASPRRVPGSGLITFVTVDAGGAPVIGLDDRGDSAVLWLEP